jgi:hypothetical protein
VAERLKEAPASQEKGLTQIACCKRKEQLLKKNKKIPNYCAIGIVLFAAISTALKNGRKELLFTTTHWPLAIKLSVLYFIS